MLDKIYHNNELLAIKCNVKDFDEGVNFFTDEEMPLQVGILKHLSGTIIQPHEHKVKLRQIERTNEVLIILTGKLRANFYFEKMLVSNRICQAGDVLLLINGGHGFEIIEKACIVEAKLGPYLQEDDKERF